MKKMKKLASILLAAIMVLAMMVPAMAEDTPATKGTIEVQGMTDKALKAYQIFSGTQADGSDVLGNIVWGKDIDDKDFLSALVSADILDGILATSSAEEVAKALVSQSASTLQRFADLAKTYVTGDGITLTEGKNQDIDSGYYLVLDKTEGADPVNVALLQVTNGEETKVTMKTDVPSVDKEVLDEEEDADSTSTDNPNIALNENGWGETADHEIGEPFQFKLTAKIPAATNVDIYKAYKVAFHDAISSGITYVGDLHVYVSNGAINTDSEVAVGKYDASKWFKDGTDGSQDGILTIPDVNDLGMDPEQDIFITVIYTAKLNSDAVVSTPTDGKLDTGENNNNVYLEYSNETSGDGTGNTTTDNVYVFTYQIPGKKTDGEGAALEGARFALYREVEGGKIVYAKMEDGKLTGWTDPVDKDADVPEGAAQVDSDANGLFNFAGFDLGTYHLRETVTPPGYNTAPDADVTITATHVEITDGATTEEKVSEGSEIVVVNNKGTTLPETGGIGTTIFYVLGSILVLGAVILLVTKKRMSVEK